MHSLQRCRIGSNCIAQMYIVNWWQFVLIYLPDYGKNKPMLYLCNFGVVFLKTKERPCYPSSLSFTSCCCCLCLTEEDKCGRSDFPSGLSLLSPSAIVKKALAPFVLVGLEESCYKSKTALCLPNPIWWDTVKVLCTREGTCPLSNVFTVSVNPHHND